jgi:Peptidase family M28
MRKRSISRQAIIASIALMTGVLISSATMAQMDQGPKTDKTYGIGLPRDHASQLFSDNDYPVFSLKPGQEAYKGIDGARMKKDVIALSQIALRYRDTVNKQWWGRFPGTEADRAGMKYMNDEFARLGLKVESFSYVLPRDWRPQSWNASFTTSNGDKIDLNTAFPVSGTKGTGPDGLTAEAIWVGIGAEPDFLGRNVKGKAVIIYSTFVPGGRSHSASDRAGLFNANARAQKLGAAMIINVMAVPGNGQFQPEGGLRSIPQITVSQDEGFALRDRLGAGEKVTFTLHLNVPEVTDVETAWTMATLPGASDEQIVIMTHTDGYFQAATDNNSGMAGTLELARHYAAIPQAQRARTMVFIQFPDHHHGEVARGRKDVGIDATYNWSKVALKLTMEHPSETLLYMYNSNLTATNQMSSSRWNAFGSAEFERMAFEQLRDFGVSVYGVEDGPKNGNYAPSFHIINHVVYHTSLDTPDLVPAEGMSRSIRAFASIIDHVNKMTMAQLRGPNFPPKDERGTILGAIGEQSLGGQSATLVPK